MDGTAVVLTNGLLDAINAKTAHGLIRGSTRFEILGLVLFVAIPLPVTGAWTGTIAAFVFGVKKRVALPAIFLGICIAGVVVTLAVTGVISFWGIATGRSGG